MNTLIVCMEIIAICIHAFNAQRVIIWSDNMDTNNNLWTGHNQFDFAMSSSQCETSPCAQVRAYNGISYIQKTTDITSYHSIQLQVDVTGYDLETGFDSCQILYDYDNTQWTELREWPANKNNNRYKNQIVDFPQSNTANMLSIRLQINGDSSRGADRCYWDNLILKGIPFTLNPSIIPTLSPTKNPIHSPTQSPSNNPTLIPSNTPSLNPSKHPSNIPSYNPTVNPSQNPSTIPSYNPTTAPTQHPSDIPSKYPTIHPSKTPSDSPSVNPTQNPLSNHPTVSPSHNPSYIPSYNPTVNPSQNPSNIPSTIPSYNPTTAPAHHPSYSPSKYPTIHPSKTPSDGPSANPTVSPSYNPSYISSYNPTVSPSQNPSNIPSNIPSYNPTTAHSSYNPSTQPLTRLSEKPSDNPSVNPTQNPSMVPTSAPIITTSQLANISKLPTFNPIIFTTTKHPLRTTTFNPTNTPTKKPTIPSETPTPTSFPTAIPMFTPTHQPTQHPTLTSIPSETPTFSPTPQPTQKPSRMPSTSPNNFVTFNTSTMAPLDSLEATVSVSTTINLNSNNDIKDLYVDSKSGQFDDITLHMGLIVFITAVTLCSVAIVIARRMCAKKNKHNPIPIITEINKSTAFSNTDEVLKNTYDIISPLQLGDYFNSYHSKIHSKNQQSVQQNKTAEIQLAESHGIKNNNTTIKVHAIPPKTVSDSGLEDTPREKPHHHIYPTITTSTSVGLSSLQRAINNATTSSQFEKVEHMLNKFEHKVTRNIWENKSQSDDMSSTDTSIYFTTETSCDTAVNKGIAQFNVIRKQNNTYV